MFAQHLYERVCVYTCVHVLVLLQEVVPRPLTVEKQLLPELLQTAAALHQVGRVVPAHRLGTGHTHTHTHRCYCSRQGSILVLIIMAGREELHAEICIQFPQEIQSLHYI